MTRIYGKPIALALFLLVSAGCTDHLKEGMGAYKRGDFQVAMRELMPLAESGNAMAQHYVGFMYDNGEGVPADYRQAVVWYGKAAEQGMPVAQHNLGMMYGLGLGVQQNWVQALKWLNLAVISSKSNYDQAVKDGNFAAAKMTPAQIREAERLVDEWLVQHGDAPVH
jgi:uncharacterized protein